MRASQRPPLCSVTPRKREEPREKDLLRLRSWLTSSSCAGERGGEQRVRRGRGKGWEQVRRSFRA